MRSRTNSKNMVALAAVCLSALMLGLEISSIPAILPTLERVLPADFKQLQWIVNGYTLAMTTCLMATGALGDRFGRRRIFAYGIVIFGFASLICGLAANAPLLIAARCLQGASAAAMLACQIAVLSHQFRDGRERSTAFGLWGIIFGIGLGFGPIVGDLIATLLTWRWVFLVHAALACVALVLTRTGVEESSDPDAVRIDLAGIVSLSLAVFCLVYLIIQGHGLYTGDPTGLAIATIGLASFAAFIVVENSMSRPMFDFRAFRTRNFSGALIGSSGMNFSFWPFVIYLPIYFQGVLGLDDVAAGLALLAYTLPTLVVPPVAERLLLHYGPRTVIPLGLFTIGLGFFLMHFAATGFPSGWAIILPGCIVAGVGLGLTNTPVTNTTTASLPVERAGMASGMDMSARFISLSINIALMGFTLLEGIHAKLGSAAHDLVESIGGGNLSAGVAGGMPTVLAREALAHGFGWVMLYGAIAAWVMAALSLIVFEPRKNARLKATQQAAE